MSKITQPVIKWSGSKRSQAKTIIEKIPKKNYKTYYEPFIGGGSVLIQVLQSSLSFEEFICSDINEDLINLWKQIKSKPNELIEAYTNMWNEANHNDSTIETRKQYFYKVRERFNISRNPNDFMFIMRTTTNGMPRYNQKNEFNNSFHVTRKGMQPKTLQKIILQWSELLNQRNVQFVHSSYENIKPDINDFVYLDPPYANTKGMYFGAIDYDILWKWLQNSYFDFILSFDGTVTSHSNGKQDLIHPVPNELFQKHELINSGNSSFRRVIGKSNDSIVSESLYSSEWKKRLENDIKNLKNNTALGELRVNNTKGQLYYITDDLGEFDYFEIEMNNQELSETLYSPDEVEDWLINYQND